MLKQLAYLGFLLGVEVVPYILTKLGIPAGKTLKTVTGHSNLWTGMLLGAGAAFIIMGLAMGSGGTLLPALLSTVLAQGILGAVAGSVGWGLFHAGELELGISVLDKLKGPAKKLGALLGFLKKPPQTGPDTTTQGFSAVATPKKFGLRTKHLTGQFKNAVTPAKTELAFRPARIVSGPSLS